MGSKKWKHSLLSTGVPLEHSVANLLSDIPGLHVTREYCFDRIEEGQAKQHSADFLATFQSTPHNLAISFLIEAKYRQPNTTWAYRPKAFHASASPTLSQFFVGLDALTPGITLNTQEIDTYGKYFPAGVNPIEFRPKSGGDFDVVTYVDDGTRQLTFATAKRVSDSLISQTRCGDAVFTPLHIIVPIAVTTSALTLFSKPYTVRDVEQASAPEDLYGVHGESGEITRLFTFQRLDNVNFVDHVLHALEKGTNKLEWGLLQDRLLGNYSEGIRGYLEYLSARHCNVFMIVELERLVPTIRRLIAFLTSPVALTAKAQFARHRTATG
jgi:hypothetical protein